MVTTRFTGRISGWGFGQRTRTRLGWALVPLGTRIAASCFELSDDKESSKKKCLKRCDGRTVPVQCRRVLVACPRPISGGGYMCACKGSYLPIGESSLVSLVSVSRRHGIGSRSLVVSPMPWAISSEWLISSGQGNEMPIDIVMVGRMGAEGSTSAAGRCVFVGKREERGKKPPWRDRERDAPAPDDEMDEYGMSRFSNTPCRR